MPVSSASSTPDRVPPPRSMSTIVGAADDAAMSRTRRAGSESTDSLPWSSPCRSIGTGKGSPGLGFGSLRPSARPISIAKNGFPFEASWIRFTSGGET